MTQTNARFLSLTWSFSPFTALSRRFSNLLLASAFLCNYLNAHSAPSSPSLEYEVKAAFLLNFTRFVEWPATSFASPDAPLVICMAGEDPFGPAIDQIVEGESVNGHRIIVERIRSDQQKLCHVLYTANTRNLVSTLPAAGPGVLTVGEGSEFTQQGGIIAFVLDNRHVRFDVNLKAAATAGLKLSSKLLSVARSVEK
jgi:hypothetical protein